MGAGRTAITHHTEVEQGNERIVTDARGIAPEAAPPDVGVVRYIGSRDSQVGVRPMYKCHVSEYEHVQCAMHTELRLMDAG